MKYLIIDCIWLCLIDVLLYLFLLFSFFFLFLCVFFVFFFCWILFFPSTCMAIYGKKPRRAGKFTQASCSSPREFVAYCWRHPLAQVSCSSPRQVACLGLKLHLSPGELDASQGEFRVRNLHENIILPFLVALFLDQTKNLQNLQNHGWIFHI